MMGMGQRHSVSWLKNGSLSLSFPPALLHAAFVGQFAVCCHRRAFRLRPVCLGLSPKEPPTK